MRRYSYLCVILNAAVIGKIGALSAGFVVCGSLLFAYGFLVVNSIASYPVRAGFYGLVPAYYRFESISGGTPLVSLGITIVAAGLLIAFNNRRRVKDRLKNHSI